MPVSRAPNGKYRVGGGRAMYKSRTAAMRTYKTYLAKQRGGKK
jgi:hypothetical protein